MKRQEILKYKYEIPLQKKLTRAIREFNMIDEGDHVLVAYSGGKDSLALINALLLHQKIAKENFSISIANIQTNLTKDDAKILIKDNLEKYNLPYFIKQMDVQLTGKEKNCFWCSFNRRKKLLEIATEIGCNKIALGHHKDDFAQTSLLNLFFHSKNESIKPVHFFSKWKITLIRPMVFIEEHETISYVKHKNFPVITCSCPKDIDKNRQLIKKIIKEVSAVNPKVKSCILNENLR